MTLIYMTDILMLSWELWNVLILTTYVNRVSGAALCQLLCVRNKGFQVTARIGEGIWFRI